ncbi:MAG: serine/threonine protein kinase [Lentisphaerales bacterium]|nr:serine/threonine protein kinase [Lentisphaerales bacterium]
MSPGDLEFNQNLDELFNLAESDTEADNSLLHPLFTELQENNEPYQYFQPLAQGGMKKILRVQDTKANRLVALAMLHEEAPPEFYDSFIREARLTALLEHPNIMPIYDIGVDSSEKPYFTMALKEGDSLAHILEKRNARDRHYIERYPLEILLEIFIKICDAMSYAHSKNVIHLDLKPENIQVGQFGEVLVCDWGLGKVIGSEEGVDFDQQLFNPDLLNNMTLAGRIKGTPGYMAPEQVEENGEKSFATDVYSLGCILYSVLTDDKPFSSCSQDDILDKTLQGLNSPAKLFPDKEIPQSLNAVVVKAVALKPEDRYENVESLRADVYKFINGYSTMAENAGLIKEISLFYRRNRRVCIVVIAALIILAAATTLFIRGLRQSIHQAELAKNAAQEASRIADISRKKSEEEKNRAELLLNLYEKEKETTAFLVHGSAEVLKRKIYNLTDNESYIATRISLDHAFLYLNKMIDNKEGLEWAYEQRGYVQFLRQNMKKALDDYKRDFKDTKFANLARRFVDKSEPGKPLVINSLTTLIKELGKDRVNHGQVVLMMYYDVFLRQSLKEHSKAVKAALLVFNPNWLNAEVFFDSETSALTISGRRFNRLSFEVKNFVIRARRFTLQGDSHKVSLLKTLGLKSLSLRKTNFSNLQQLVNLSLIKLNLSHTAVKDFAPLIEIIPSLQELVVDRKQFATAKEQLPASIKIILEN